MLSAFQARLSRRQVLLLDGPTGTELSRQSVPTDGPMWSAAAIRTHPDIVIDVHDAYVAAGAEVITANTFRTHARNLQSTEGAGSANEWTQAAVHLARSAAGNRAWVAGSQAPLEDCYRPDLVPPNDELDREHAAMAEALAAAGVDLILVETHNCLREVTAATRAASRVGLPVLTSVVCGSDGRLLSGETLTEFAAAVLPFKPVGLLVNCLPAPTVLTALKELQVACGDLPVGAYANAGHRNAAGDWVRREDAEPAVYAAAVESWVNHGARIIGGCCGTQPAHISAIRQHLDRQNAAESP